MNIFVASWFFPPATSSEGIVTYKLLRNSRHHYDVFSSTSKQWGYKAAMRMRGEKNIDTYTVETDDISEWVDFCVAQFEKRYAQQKYDCVMTRLLKVSWSDCGSRKNTPRSGGLPAWQTPLPTTPMS